MFINSKEYVFVYNLKKYYFYTMENIRYNKKSETMAHVFHLTDEQSIVVVYDKSGKVLAIETVDWEE